jgi:hypothetical protein
MACAFGIGAARKKVIDSVDNSKNLRIGFHPANRFQSLDIEVEYTPFSGKSNRYLPILNKNRL